MSAEQLCLGRIKSIESYHLNLSLIHGLKGRVNITDINSSYREALEELVSGNKNVDIKTPKQMFSVGQIVRCSVKQGQSVAEAVSSLKKTPLKLSLNPDAVNRNVKKSQLKPFTTLVGAVSSIEDNGYLLDTGVQNLNVFLPFEETAIDDSCKLSIGTLVEFSIPEDQLSSDSRVFRATMLNKPKIPNGAIIPFDCLLPGMRVPVKINSVSMEGLRCSFRSFSVHVPAQHCPLEAKQYSINSQVIACIVVVDLAAKSLTASMLPHFVEDDLDELHGHFAYKHVKIGSICTDAVLKRRERNCVYLWLPLLNRSAILLKANAFDTNPSKKWTAEIPEDTPIKCRVIDFDLFLNMPIVSCRRQDLESKFLTVHNVKVGAIVSVTVKKFIKQGISVSLGRSIRGLIPFMHLSDVPIKDPRDRFKMGDKIKALVLFVNPQNKILLTAKKSLISPTSPILGSSTMLRTWHETGHYNRTKDEPFLITAFVVHLSERGILVCGMNNVCGWIPRRLSLLNNTQSAETFFRKGETLQLRVLKRIDQTANNSDTPRTRFLLSQILDSTMAPLLTPPVNTSVSLGEIYYCRVNVVKLKCLLVDLYASDTAPTPVVTEAMLPYTHLSDSNSIVRMAWRSRLVCFQPNTMFSTNADGTATPTRVVVVGVTNTGIVVSAKSSLVAAAEDQKTGFRSSGFLRSFDQLVVGSQWVGWVAHHKDYGVFIQFPGGFRGLVPKRYLSDRRAREDIDWHLLLPIGTTVEAKVVNLSAQQQRFLLSLRMLDTYGSAAEQYVGAAVVRAQRYLEECRWIFSHVDELSQLSKFVLGEVVSFQVDQLTEDAVMGTVMMAGDRSGTKVPAAALLPNTEDVECEVGSVYPAVVTLPNLDAGRLEVALLPWLLRGVKQRIGGEFASDAMKVRLGQRISSIVVSLGNACDVVVVALKQHALGHLAVLPARRCFNDIIGGNAWTLGQLNRVTIRSEVPSIRTSANKSFFATLSIYDPLRRNLKTNITDEAMVKAETETSSLAPLESLISLGARLPKVFFIGLKGRTALFRLPQTRGSRELRARLICRLVDLAPTAKAARDFLRSPPPRGTVFHNAIVVNAPSTMALEGVGGARLPLSLRVARISFIEKDPEVGDLVCAMFLGVSGISWRLLLPNDARGLLHVSCMSKSLTAEPSATLHLPRRPRNSVWLTCRIIDVQDRGADTTAEAVAMKKTGEKEVEDEVEAQIGRGDEIVPVGDEEDVPSKRPSKVYYVSTETSDLRVWNPEKYQNPDLILNTPMNAIVKCLFKKSLIISLNYKTDAVVSCSSASLKPAGQPGSIVQIVLTSLKPLRGRLANEPVRRRSASASEVVESGPSVPKRRRRASNDHVISTAPTMEDLWDRYIDFLPPLHSEEEHAQQQECAQEQQLKQNEVEDVEMKDLNLDLQNESRLAAVAQATSSTEPSCPLPHISSVEEYEVAVRNAPQNARLWILYAAHHQGAGDVVRARAVLQRALDSPTAAQGSANLGSADDFMGSILLSFLRLESTVAATSVSADVREKDPSTVDTSSTTTTNLPLLNAVISRIEQLDRVTITRRAINTLSTAGLHSHAVEMAKKFVRRHSKSSSAWLLLIRARFRAGDVAGAREAQRNAGQILRLSHLPKFAIGCAQLEFQFGDVDRAIKLLEEQLAAHPQRKIIYLTSIQLLKSAGKGAEAESVRESALQKLPEKDHASINKLFHD